MDPNIATIAYSMAYVLISIFACGIIEKYTSEFFARKLLHILVGNAVLIPVVFGASLWAAALPPLAFIIINHVLQEFGVFEADTGLIFYPFSVLLLVFLAYFTSRPIYMILPTFIMAYGDGLASLLSKNVFHKSEKSKESFIVMFFVSLAISAIFLASFDINPIWSILIAVVAAISEMSKEDNLTVPLYTASSLIAVNSSISSLLAGFGISLVISSIAYYMQALTLEGLASAVILGTVIFSVSPPVFLALLFFFLSSSLLTKYRAKDKEILKDYQKVGKRDAAQVLANGFGAAFASALISSGLPAIPFALASISAATADTWATEIGALSKRKPVLITTLKEVETGTSGGVTVLGLLASFLASLFIFLSAYPFFGFSAFSPCFVGGIAGSLIDSFLGATLQGMYLCRVCGKITEKRKHCGKATVLIKGFEWFNNDVVNLVSTLLAGTLVMI